LIILKYNFNADGICDIVYKQNNVSLPIDTTSNILRGGSNLLHYKDNLYIGASHDRIILGIYVFFFTRIMILDVDNWKIKYISKPIAYHYPHDDLLKLPNTDIIWQYHEDLNYHNVIKIMLQYPASLVQIPDGTFYLTTYFLEKRTFLYEIKLDISDEDLQLYDDGMLQQKVTNELLELINHSFTIVNPQTQTN
jgi:hypothetical protein